MILSVHVLKKGIAMKKMIVTTSIMGFVVALSACSSTDTCRGSRNMAGCGTLVHTQVPAVRIPAVVMPTGGCAVGGCGRPARSRYVEPAYAEPRIEMRESMYPKTYETYCSPRM